MPNIQTKPFHVVCAVLGVVLFLFSFVSYLVKERLYISEALISACAGLVVSPYTSDITDPLKWVHGDRGLLHSEHIESTTLDFSRLVLAVQVCLAGVQLPPRYLRKEWRSLATMLGPGMIMMWLISSFFIWAIAATHMGGEKETRMPFLHALAVGACITPTDPVLSNTIIKGRWADKHVPPRIAHLISAESGANDGLGYPFLFFALYLMKYQGTRGVSGAPSDQWAGGGSGGASAAMGMWFGETWLYVIIMGIAWGAVVAYVSRKALQFSRSLGFVDMESFFSFTVVMAVLIVGTCGMVGSNDILASFVAGNVLSWDDWFRRETKTDSFEPTIDMLLNISFFIWFGIICPWPSFTSSVIPLWRLIVLSIVILLLRRPPVLIILQKFLSQIKKPQEALFIGFFGPIGVSAIFYQHLALEFLRTEVLNERGEMRSDARLLSETVGVIVWFVVASSILVHGLSIPLYQFSVYVLHHTRPGRFAEHERYHIADLFRREKRYIGQRRWARRLEEGRAEAVSELEAAAGRTSQFRRIRHEEEGLLDLAV